MTHGLRKIVAVSAVAALAACSPAVDEAENGTMPRVCIALGAGGASGLSHISMLAVLDELGIRPHRISGSSIGAIVGALYASGMSAAEIHDLVDRFLLTEDEQFLEQVIDNGALEWLEFIDIDLGDGGLVSSRGFLSFVYDTIRESRFEDLEIPLTIVAADFWRREPVLLESGPLLPALSASMALPGVFEPVELDGDVLVDGGTVNPVPYDLLVPDCEIVAAIDVIGARRGEPGETPGYFETLFNSAKIMQAAIMREKRKRKEPDIYIQPQIGGVRALEFYKAEEVFRQAQPAKAEFERALKALLGRSASP